MNVSKKDQNLRNLFIGLILLWETNLKMASFYNVILKYKSTSFSFFADW